MTIAITQMIAHDIDLTKQTPSLASQVINLAGVPAVVLEFFTDHIATSLNARQVKASKFTEGNNFVQSQVINFASDISNTQEFIKISHSLTNELFRNMKTTSSTSHGALFFLMYTYQSGYYLAVMKMDPNQGIQIDKSDFSLKVQENMLPNPNDKLHKCAFIKLVDDFSDEEVHLHVLDRQQKAGEVSKYFMINFLGATEILNDKIMTDRVIKKLQEETLSIVPQKKALDFYVAVDKTFANGKNIDIDLDLEKLITPFVEEEKQRADFIEGFKTSLRSEYEDVSFQFKSEKDPTTVCYQSSDKKVKIEFPIEFFKTYITVDDSQKDKTIITISEIELKQKNK
ncbi:nucleoid-associated protein [Bacillus sp. FJAT-52991]|uniref:Nucleoid-associated protein n=1 Tax=Bacillus kandeliae TaxID=3129297 RepID=A0ABZ2N9T8_9BACI